MSETRRNGQHRTAKQRIRALESQITAIKAAERRQRGARRAVRHAGGALASVERALALARDNELRAALRTARNSLESCLSICDAVASGRGKAKARRRGPTVGRYRVPKPADALAFIRDHPGCSRAQLTTALSTSEALFGSLIQELVIEGLVRATMEHGALRYSPAQDLPGRATPR